MKRLAFLVVAMSLAASTACQKSQPTGHTGGGAPDEEADSSIQAVDPDIYCLDPAPNDEAGLKSVRLAVVTAGPRSDSVARGPIWWPATR
jgi:hypothetical protein